MKIVLTGKVPSKKNSRVTTRSGRSFPNKTYVDWEKDVIQQLHLQKWDRVLTYPIGVTCKFYVPDDVGRDMDNMLSSVLDVIKDEKKKINGKMTVVRESVVKDDSWQHLNPIVLSAEIDRKQPRVEIYFNE